MICEFENGMTIKDLLEFIKINKLDIDEGELWIMTGKNLSSPCIEISTLNKNDICLSIDEYKRN